MVRFKLGKDIREFGSGNIGATNVSRVLGKNWAIAAFIVDALKGFTPIWIVSGLFGGNPAFVSICVLAAVLGHCYCPWLGWNGGKGVAVAAGAVLAVAPLAAVVGMATYLVFLKLTHVSAAGSLAGLLTTNVFLAIYQPQWLGLGICIGVLLVWRHRGNIKQLLAKRASP
jgi:glycerol-3-phosphate acyltransferase PlsY